MYKYLISKEKSLKEKNREYYKNYYRKNREKIKKYYQKYYQEHKEEIYKRTLESQQKYRQSEKGQRYRKKYSKKYYRNHRHRWWAHSTIQLHKKYGHIINISTDELEQIAKKIVHCPICNCKLKWESGKSSSISPSLDRINNGKIINKNNIWIICRKCNASKQDRTLKEFVEYCKIVIKQCTSI